MADRPEETPRTLIKAVTKAIKDAPAAKPDDATVKPKPRSAARPPAQPRRPAVHIEDETPRTLIRAVARGVEEQVATTANPIDTAHPPKPVAEAASKPAAAPSVPSVAKNTPRSLIRNAAQSVENAPTPIRQQIDRDKEQYQRELQKEVELERNKPNETGAAENLKRKSMLPSKEMIQETPMPKRQKTATLVEVQNQMVAAPTASPAVSDMSMASSPLNTTSIAASPVGGTPGTPLYPPKLYSSPFGPPTHTPSSVGPSPQVSPVSGAPSPPANESTAQHGVSQTTKTASSKHTAAAASSSASSSSLQSSSSILSYFNYLSKAKPFFAKTVNADSGKPPKSSKARVMAPKDPNAPKRTRKKKTDDGPQLPPTLSKKIFHSFSNMRVTKDALQEIVEGTRLFFDSISEELYSYAKRDKRRTIQDKDVVRLLKKQKLISETRSVEDLARAHLPLEYLEEIVPVAKALSAGKMEEVTDMEELQD